MSIDSVKIKIKDKYTELVFNETTGVYEAEIEAPDATSYNLAGGYYPITLEVVNSEGMEVSKDDTDAAFGNILRLYVKETVKPIITLKSPSDGSHVQDSSFPIVFSVSDETGGSGVDESSIDLKFDGNSVEVFKQNTGYGFECTYLPEDSTAEGSHNIQISAKDNDGNSAEPIDISYIIDKTSPTLVVTSPDFSVTNQQYCLVSGVTYDNLSNIDFVGIWLNNKKIGDVSVDNDGIFSKEILLLEGKNVIHIKSTDKSGRSSAVQKEVQLDTVPPEVYQVNFEPNPLSEKYPVRITLEVI
ncbi:MAG: Ig-like domain-containing protein [Bacteroidales bacterium]|nr:Ig-like domain-containing protein [Lachnoclostridium sp.]MCM1385258.1 Ig-like domain-containing protein [Lachnoclostridium sp.]MCM1466156.1 Ig-like domain-containing protein [Bacteroidales bacterium]